MNADSPVTEIKGVGECFRCMGSVLCIHEPEVILPCEIVVIR